MCLRPWFTMPIGSPLQRFVGNILITGLAPFTSINYALNVLPHAFDSSRGRFISRSLPTPLPKQQHPRHRSYRSWSGSHRPPTQPGGWPPAVGLSAASRLNASKLMQKEQRATEATSCEECNRKFRHQVVQQTTALLSRGHRPSNFSSAQLSRIHLLKLCADSHEQVQCGGIKIGLLTIEIVRSAIPVPSYFRVK